MHAVVARSTSRIQKCQRTDGLGALLEAVMSKKRTLLWREADFEVKMLYTNTTFSDHFLTFQMSFRVAGARDWAPLVKSEQNVRVF